VVRKKLLCDVDGVVADLMGGMSSWLELCGFPPVDPRDITLFDIRKAARQPELIRLDDELRSDEFGWPEPDGDGGINGAFMTFMRGEAYDYVKPIAGAIEGIAELQEHYDVRFCTALMEAAPEHVPSKMAWMKRHFPTVPYFTAPSKLKMEIKGDLGIDDRYDTCMRWEEVGTKSFLFGQAWNEAPDGHPRYDWSTIVRAIRNG
jgi:hypothetical protein